MFRKMSLLLAVSMVGVLLAGCGGPTTVNISLTTYAITADKVEGPAGDFIFKVTNDATDQKHEFVIVKTDLAADALPLNSENNVDEDKLTPVDEVEDIEPGANGELDIKLEAGHYVLLCNTPGHYNQGMHIDFDVK